MSQELDLTPDTRVLQMLGEIDLQQWRCLAELVDNAIDGFMLAARSADPIENPEINVSLPAADIESARVVVRDNGPGMSMDTLEHAVRAGWTGKNNPLADLGLFGMGFNIATARLGLVTEVWTSRRGDREDVGVRIDLDELRTTKSFRVPRQIRAKSNSDDHGTEVIISRLKPEQRLYLARANNQKTIRKHFERTYSALLSHSEVGRIRLNVNRTRLGPRRHCVWDRSRSVELPNGNLVSAIELIDVALAPRRYCTHCMRALSGDEQTCPTGSRSCSVIDTQRRVRGWVGLQRYLDKTDFGIDFIRNGRKIEIGNKDLFVWSDGESNEVEYPIDDPRNRGRIVGEIHLDHCRVSYTKDRFERDDPSWGEMVRVVRGDGPLRPVAAKQRGYDGNESPLFKHFQAFRRSSPQGKGGLWSRVLVVRDNDRSQQMAVSFAEDDPDYLTDDRWWQLVQEQDGEVLNGTGSDKPVAIPEGFLDNVGQSGSVRESPVRPYAPPSIPTPPPTPARRPLHELTRKYVHPTFRVEYEVQAFAVGAGDLELPAGLPWVLRLQDVATRTYEFLVRGEHEVFRSTTMTFLDALLVELTWRTVDFLKGQSQEPSFSLVLSDFRRQYCIETRLDPQELIGFANGVLVDIARAVPRLVGKAGSDRTFKELTQAEQESIARRMASRGVADHRPLILDGRFWEYADAQTLKGLFIRHPEFFFDGHYWEDPFMALDFGVDAVTNEARRRISARYEAYLGDAEWLASQTPSDLDRANRDTVIRAQCSLRLLRPDVEE
jgi:Histidine kinase-, DNA gyrase B-, and HSP90-like ATPase